MYEILYIEDEADMLDDLPVVLGRWDLQLITRPSVQEALDLFSERSFDAVLLDICMPPALGMVPEEVRYGRETGVEVARRLKAVRPAVPIIALTVVNDPEIIGRMRAAGISHVIDKPEDALPIAEAIIKEIKKCKT